VSISGFRVFGATNETFSVLGGSSYKLYISRRTSPWKLQPATILTDTNSMNFSQHSSYGQRNVPLHGPSPRAQANGVCKPGALQTCLSTPARLQGTSTPTPKRECLTPPPPPPPPRAEICRRPYRRRSRPPPPSPPPRQFLVYTKCCQFLTALGSGDAQYVKKMPRTAVHPRAGSCTGGMRAGCFLVRQQKCFGLPAVFAGAAGGVGVEV